MRAVLVYSIIFALPLVIYLLWLRFLARKLSVLLLLPLIVCGVWLALWPANWLPVYEAATKEPVGDRSDSIVTGFILLGWIYGVIGCIPVIVIDAIRNFLRWGAKRRAAAGAIEETGDL